MIDRIACPIFALDRGQIGTLGRHERPVRFPLGALIDPAADKVDLLIGEA